MDEEDDEISILCTVCGDHCCAKALLCVVLNNPNFNFNGHIPTGFDNSIMNEAAENHKRIQINVDASWISGDLYKTIVKHSYSLSLWDTTGQEELDRHRHLSYRGKDIFVLVFNSTQSLNSIENKWIPDVRSSQSPNAGIILVHSHYSKWATDEDYSDIDFMDIDAEHVLQIIRSYSVAGCIAVDVQNKDSINYLRARICEIGEYYRDYLPYERKPSAKSSQTNTINNTQNNDEKCTVKKSKTCLGKIKTVISFIMYYFSLLILFPFMMTYRFVLHRDDNVDDIKNNLKESSVSGMSIGIISYTSDIVLDCLVLKDFIMNHDVRFFVSMLLVMIISQIASGIVCAINMKNRSNIWAFCAGFFYLAMFDQIYDSVIDGKPTITFRRVRIIESILEAIPSSLLTSYFLISGSLSQYNDSSLLIFYLSLFSSFFSISRSLAKYEAEVLKLAQFSFGFVIIFICRFCEIYSRIIILAAFTFITKQYFGLLILMVVNYIFIGCILFDKKGISLETMLVTLLFLAVYAQNLTSESRDSISFCVFWIIRIMEFMVILGLFVYAFLMGEIDDVWDQHQGMLISSVSMFVLSLCCMSCAIGMCVESRVSENVDQKQLSIDDPELEYKKTLEKIRQENTSGIFKK